MHFVLAQASQLAKFSEPNHSGHLGSKMSNFHLFSAESVQKALPMRAAKRRASGEPEAPSNKDIKGTSLGVLS